MNRASLKAIVGGAILLALLNLSIAQDQNEKIDFDRARKLIQKQRGGEKLTDDEKAYLDKARAARRRGRPNRPDAPRRNAAPQAKPSLGIAPLTEMSADQKYKNQTGGLYGEGRNQPPEKHLLAALKQANRILPLDEQGRPAADGQIVMISVGMSNTTQEFSQFVRLAQRDEAKSPAVKVIDCAQGGQEASDWAFPKKRVRKDRPSVWEVVDQRLRRAGVSDAQVQVAWIKQARRNPAGLGEFPKHAEELKDNLAQILRMLKTRFPNLQIAYLSSRIYAGYASSNLNPEPYAFESAFSVRWLIEQQIEGGAALNHDPQQGEVTAPLALWGPYLWGDGQTPRKADKLIWTRDDFASDGTHPSGAGREKVAQMLLDFFHTDPTAKAWYLRGPGSP